MNPQDGSLIEKIDELLTLQKENNKLIKAMRRDALIGGIVKTLIWVVLIVGSFYLSMQFLTPYLGMLEQLPKEGDGGTDYKALFEQYKDLLGN